MRGWNHSSHKNKNQMSNINTKEIQKYQSYVEKIGKYSSSLEVKTDGDYKSAMTEGIEIKDKLKEITNRKEEITKPMNAALKSVRDLFKPIETAGEVALKTIKDKMLAFSEKTRQEAEAAKIKLGERVEKGTMKVETAVRKMEDIKEPEKTIKTDEGKATNVVRKAWRVIDKSKIPLEFMEPNMVAIKASFRAGKLVDGVEEYEETGLTLG